MGGEPTSNKNPSYKLASWGSLPNIAIIINHLKQKQNGITIQNVDTHRK